MGFCSPNDYYLSAVSQLVAAVGYLEFYKHCFLPVFHNTKTTKKKNRPLQNPCNQIRLFQHMGVRISSSLLYTPFSMIIILYVYRSNQELFISLAQWQKY